MDRRNLLKLGLMGSVSAVGGRALAQACGGLTPAQAEGPFYPTDKQVREQQDKDNNLIWASGKKEKALGEEIIIRGVVTDQNCQPVGNAIVEIWQACHTGKYDHPSDPNPAEKDENFQYWGLAWTDKFGRYDFKTIKPGHYRATSEWVRPAHIHYKVHKRGYKELITQMYFSDDQFNSGDRILMSLPASERAKVVVEFAATKESPIPVGQFNIQIEEIS